MNRYERLGRRVHVSKKGCRGRAGQSAEIVQPRDAATHIQAQLPPASPWATQTRVRLWRRMTCHCSRASLQVSPCDLVSSSETRSWSRCSSRRTLEAESRRTCARAPRRICAWAPCVTVHDEPRSFYKSECMREICLHGRLKSRRAYLIRPSPGLIERQLQNDTYHLPGRSLVSLLCNVFHPAASEAIPSSSEASAGP